MTIPKQFRRTVEIWGKVKALNKLNQTTFDDEKLMTVSAEIVPQTGSLQKQQAETLLANVSHKIVMRYREGILPNMYIMYKGKRYDIKYILNPYEMNQTLEIFATEVIQ